MHKDRKMAATVWFDSKPVVFLSTSANPLGPGAYANRWLQGDRRQLRTTPQQVEYQTNMRGVDVVDQMRRDYTVQFHSRKWWHKVFMFTVDSSLQNGWVLFCHDRTTRHDKLISRRRFLYNIALALIEPRLPLPRTCSPYNASPQAVHYSVASPNRRRICVVCKRKQSRYCPPCGNVYMCDDPCFRIVHSRRRWGLRLSQQNQRFD